MWQVMWWGRPRDARLKLRILLDRLLWILTRLYPASSRAVPEPCFVSVTLYMATDDGRWGWVVASGCGAENVVREWAITLWGLVYRNYEALLCNSDWLSIVTPLPLCEMLSQYVEAHGVSRSSSSGHRVLLFSQMTQLLDILQDYMDYRGMFCTLWQQRAYSNDLCQILFLWFWLISWDGEGTVMRI